MKHSLRLIVLVAGIGTSFAASSVVLTKTLGLGGGAHASTVAVQRVSTPADPAAAGARESARWE